MSKRSAFVSVVDSAMKSDPLIVLLLGDISIYSFRETFKKYPLKALNLGIAEQASIGVAAGLSMSGLYPIYSTISAFLVRRAYEFLKLDFGEQQLSGLFVGIGGANEYAKLGPTHQCAEEKALVHHIHNMRFYDPCDDEDTADTIAGVIRRRELAYVRLEERV